MGCQVRGCDDTGQMRKGLCPRHYMQQWRGKDLARIPARRPLTRLMQQVQITNDHWLWLGKVDSHGRGRFRLGRQEIRADRYVWQVFNGPLEGVLRNACGEPACVCPEPEHRRPA